MDEGVGGWGRGESMGAGQHLGPVYMRVSPKYSKNTVKKKSVYMETLRG